MARSSLPPREQIRTALSAALRRGDTQITGSAVSLPTATGHSLLPGAGQFVPLFWKHFFLNSSLFPNLLPTF